MSEQEDEYATIAGMYDHVPAYVDRGDVAFYGEAARRAGGAVLEIGCGTGRVLLPYARTGVEAVGLDSSPAMLEVLRTRLEQESAGIRGTVDLVRGDMRDFSLGRRFALAIIPFRPFQHLTTVEDQLSCLACVRDHLVNGGRFILDVFNPSIEALANRVIGEEIAESPDFVLPDGRRVERRHKTLAHDRANQVLDLELLYYVTHPDGRSERLVHGFQMRYLFRFELEHLLARCGFLVESVLAGFDGTPYGSMYPGDLIFTARRA